MIIDRHIMQEYPFKGAFYIYGVDESKPAIEQVDEEILILETKCDIQEAQKSDSEILIASYNVYFPFDKKEGIKIDRGMYFKGDMYGLHIDGEVIGVFPTQLGGCGVYLTDRTVGVVNNESTV